MNLNKLNEYDACHVNQEIPYLEDGSIDYARLNEFFTPNTVVLETDAFKLRFFGGDASEDAILVIVPNAGHTASIGDYAKDQSIIECAQDNTNKRVYLFEWKSCTPSRSRESYGDLVNMVMMCVDFIGSKVHLVGLCMGGTVACITTALHPDRFASVTIAGAPIDVTEPSILQQAIKTPITQYQMVVGLSGGLMYGNVLLECWKSSDIKRHYFDRVAAGEPKDYRTARFESWYYKHVSNLAGEGWYIWLVENLFQKNLLVKGEMVVNDAVVKLGDITCPVNLVVGFRDDISVPSHTLNLKDHVGTDDVSIYGGNAGHLSVFMGRKMIATCWTEIFQTMK